MRSRRDRNAALLPGRSHFFCLTIDSYTDGGSYPLPDQTTDLWLWDNVDNGSPVDHVRLGWNSTMETQLGPYLQEGRDYHFVQKAGYSPFPYPHPDRDGVGGEGASGGEGGAAAAGGAGASPATGGGGATTATPAAGDPSDDGCGCRTYSQPPARWSWAVATLGALGVARRRRR